MILLRQYYLLYRYTAASLIALIIDYSIYVLILYWAVLSVPHAAVIGYSGGILVSYFLLKNKVFGQGWLSDKPSVEFAFFILSSILGLIVTYFVAVYTIFLFGQLPHLAKIVSSIFSFFTVYFFRKKIVFRSFKVFKDKF